MRRFVIGTAGHVDHGKTALVEALTGVNPDRLPEEKLRGMSIELGFAPLYDGDHQLAGGIVDVPGHEKFVQTMVGGAAGIDVALIVIATDEGIRPQTTEHLEILNLLGVKRGIVALTKSDLCAPESLEERFRQVSDGVVPYGFENALMVAVSARERTGLDELKRMIFKTAGTLEAVPPGPVFLPIDRVFSVHGFGTVITGTLDRGILRKGDGVEILPSGRRASIRTLQTFGQTVDQVEPRMRVAVNLSGIRREEIAMGDLLVAPGSLHPTRRVKGSVTWLKPSSGRVVAGVRFHAGTTSFPCRIVAEEIRFRTPVFLRSGERFIVRKESPATTLGGGMVLDPHPPEKRPLKTPLKGPPVRETLKAERTQAVLRVLNAGRTPPTVDELALELNSKPDAIRRELRSAEEAGWLKRVNSDVYVNPKEIAEMERMLLTHFSAAATLDIARWKELAGVSRKYAIPLLEYFDREKITLCRPDRVRVLWGHTTKPK